MQKIQLSKNVSVSRIVHGLWRLSDWSLTQLETQKLIEQCIEKGVTTFDHADIYGNYTCEKLFGAAFSNSNIERTKVQFVSKCGIKLISEKAPETSIKHYDYSYEHIINSVENSLNYLRTDYLDVLLLHRPSPMLNPTEVAKAFQDLNKSGKVLSFGVSNFTPQQFNMLNSYLDEKLVTNQIEISPLCVEPFTNNLEFLLEQKVAPMGWSPLAGGKIFNPKTEKEKTLKECLQNIADELNVDGIDKIAYAWLMAHPSNIIPIVGSGKIDRIQNAVKALDIKLSLEHWFKIYTASLGKNVA